MTNGITAEKLAQVAAMVAAQKAKLNSNGAEKNISSVKHDAKSTADISAKKIDMEARRSARAAERQSKALAKAASKASNPGIPSFQRKINKLQAALPPSTPNLQQLSQYLTNFSDVELTNALQYVEFERRCRGLRATGEARMSNDVALKVGDKVRIKNCNARKFIGQVGIVTLVRRIRAFVEVPGFDTKAYVFSTDVDLLEARGEVSQEDESVDKAQGVNILDVEEGDHQMTGS